MKEARTLKTVLTHARGGIESRIRATEVKKSREGGIHLFLNGRFAKSIAITDISRHTTRRHFGIGLANERCGGLIAIMSEASLRSYTVYT
jgi:hypothetical protein